MQRALSSFLTTLKLSGRPGSLPYWGGGRFDLGGMNRMVDAQRQVGAQTGAVDWTKIIERRFLPADLQKDY